MSANVSGMNHVRVDALADDPAVQALPELAVASPAAWLIDVMAGQILASNKAGSDLLGLKSSDTLVLDAAMPALRRLRELSARPSELADTPERLVFWSRTGLVQASFRVRFVEGATTGHSVVVTMIAEVQAPHVASKDLSQLEGARPAATAQTSDAKIGGLTPLERASLAHELKTPLAAITAAAEIMKDERLGGLGNARYAGYATDIYDSARHALSVVDRTLAEARAYQPKLDLDFIEIDVADALRKMASQLTPLAESAGLSLSIDIPAGLPKVIADATSLRQIVLNLVTNALKFTPHSGAIVVGAQYEGDGPLAIVVRDTGAGMANVEDTGFSQPAASQPASRGSDSPGGLGLGLPLAQRLATANGASLLLESKIGEGTVASLIFPKDRVIPI